MADDALERSYRRLLLAYPRRYRRERGTEILTTLLDAARPGQRRPTRREAIDLLLGGLRRRLAIPRGPIPVMAATVVALLAALGAAAGTGWLTWRAAAPQPDLAAASAAVEVAIPLPPARDPLLFDNPLELAGDANFDPASARLNFQYAVPAATIPTQVSDARHRLVAAGWQAGDIRDDHGLLSFWAARGDHVVQVGGYPHDPGATEPLWAEVRGRAPGWIAPAVLAGALLGAAVGWLAAGWVLRRSRPAVVVCGGLGLFMGAPVLLSAAYYLVAAVATHGWSTMDALFPALALVEVQPLGQLAAAWLLLAGLVAALPRRAGAAPEHPWRMGLWAAASAHLAFAVAWCVVVGLYLGRLAANGGDRQGMVGGAYDPKDLVPFGLSGANPFTWVYALLTLLYLFGFLASPGLLTVSVPLLVATRRTLAVASGRIAWRVLLVAAVTALVLPVATATPLGRDALTWWMD